MVQWTSTTEAAVPHTLLKPVEAARRLGISRSYLFELVAKGELPRPVKFNPRRVAFIESEIDSHIEALAAQRNSQE
jgi:prophage regulatory protein